MGSASQSARTSFVEADFAKGRLAVPFKIALPANARFYQFPRRPRPIPRSSPHSGNGCLRRRRTKPEKPFADAGLADFSGWSRRTGMADCGQKTEQLSRQAQVMAPAARPRGEVK